MPRYLIPTPCGALITLAVACGSPAPPAGGGAGPLTEAASLAWDVIERRCAPGADQPVPLDDAVSGVWRERLIYLVSGWSTDRTVATVQAYDAADRRAAAPTLPARHQASKS